MLLNKLNVSSGVLVVQNHLWLGFGSLVGLVCFLVLLGLLLGVLWLNDICLLYSGSSISSSWSSFSWRILGSILSVVVGLLGSLIITEVVILTQLNVIVSVMVVMSVLNLREGLLGIILFIILFVVLFVIFFIITFLFLFFLFFVCFYFLFFSFLHQFFPIFLL